MKSKRDTLPEKAMTSKNEVIFQKRKNRLKTTEIKSPRENVNASDCSEQKNLSNNNPGPTSRRSIRTRKEPVKLKDYVRR